MRIHKFILIAFLLMFGSCRTKKSLTESEKTIMKDSIIYKEVIIKSPAINDTILIKSPCDSLGNLKPFKQVITAPQGKITIEGKNNQIKGNIQLNETNNSSKIDKDYHSNNIQKSKELIKRVVVPDWRLIIVLIISIILNIYFIYNRFFK